MIYMSRKGLLGDFLWDVLTIIRLFYFFFYFRRGKCHMVWTSSCWDNIRFQHRAHRERSTTSWRICSCTSELELQSDARLNFNYGSSKSKQHTSCCCRSIIRSSWDNIRSWGKVQLHMDFPESHIDYFQCDWRGWWRICLWTEYFPRSRQQSVETQDESGSCRYALFYVVLTLFSREGGGRGWGWGLNVPALISTFSYF